ncbi:hypothetical protein FRC01_006304 [Tulasnella sp. 417]|nr:hypothetical protein FRC01_006304 [Tulasnella sp. 417]
MNALNPALFEIPNPLKNFGQDGGRFYRCYDAIAEDLDEDMVKGLKEQLDGLLIFAGLFAGVNSAFLALTLPLLSPDPADDISTLLAQNNEILMQLVLGRNDSTPGISSLPSNDFSPSRDILAVNVLFSLSLSFALISSFLAVLGRQWLIHYRKRSGGGPSHQRWEQLKRFLGAERWHLQLILDDILPSLLLFGLIIFCISLLIYLNGLNPTVSKVVGPVLAVGLAFFIGSALCTIWDKFCPFNSPLSHFILWAVEALPFVVHLVKDGLLSLLKSLKDGLVGVLNNPRLTYARIFEKAKQIQLRELWEHSSLNRWAHLLKSGREEESDSILELTALQRAICISDEPTTLLCAVANITTIIDPKHLRQLWDHEAFRERLLELYQTSYDRTLQLFGQDSVDIALSSKRLYLVALAHFLFNLDHSLLDAFGIFRNFLPDPELGPVSVWIPKDVRSDCPLISIRSYLAVSFVTVMWDLGSPTTEDFWCLLTSYSDALMIPDWGLVSLLCWMIYQLPTVSASSLENIGAMKGPFTGDVPTALESIDKALITILQLQDSIVFIDSDRLLANVLRGISQVLADQREDPGLRAYQLMKILRRAEGVIRSKRWSSEVASLVQNLRRVVVAKLMGVKPGGEPPRHPRWVSEKDLRALISLVETLQSASPMYISHGQDADALDVFTPFVHKLFSHDIIFTWEGQIMWRDYPHPEPLSQALSSLRGAWEGFTSKVENSGAAQQVEHILRRARDPERRWCYWQGGSSTDI